MVWFSACYYSYVQYYDLKTTNVTGTWGYSEAFAMNFSYYLQLKETWLAFGKKKYLSCFIKKKITILIHVYINVYLKIFYVWIYSETCLIWENFCVRIDRPGVELNRAIKLKGTIRWEWNPTLDLKEWNRL